jgi:hypothetical protein
MGHINQTVTDMTHLTYMTCLTYFTTSPVNLQKVFTC